MLRLLIFTDLDGTLLDADSYSFDAAQEALDLLRAREVPLILASSKTRAEIESLRHRLRNHHPFIVENGGAVFLPQGYFGVPPKESVVRDAYQAIELGAPYAALRSVLKDIVLESGIPVRGFGDLSAQEVAELTGLTVEGANLAKQREYDEPLVIESPPEVIARLGGMVQARGLRLSRAGRFYHLSGATDKGAACRYLVEAYRRDAGRKGDRVLTVGLGDSLNDLPMLIELDRAIVVQKPDGSYDSRLAVPRLEFAPGPGPVGWNRAVLEILRTH
jgi:mannosyl-3-phosphoglycerate phosphatase